MKRLIRRALRAPAALGADPRAEVRGGHDHRQAAGHMPQDGVGQQLALGIAEHELLGEVGQDAQPVGTRIDHEIDAAQLAGQVQRTRLGEGGGNDREDSISRERTSFSRKSLNSVNSIVILNAEGGNFSPCVPHTTKNLPRR